MSRPQRLADFVRVRVSEARIEQRWAELERAGLPGPVQGRGHHKLGFAAVALLAASAAGAVLWMQATRPMSLPAFAVIESAENPIAVQLNDGSHLELSPRARLRLLHNDKREVRLDLRDGRVRFAVTHDRARSFKILAGVAEVSVIGTRFSLERRSDAQGTRLHVSVSEGVVEVRRQSDGDVRRLRAGESWSAFEPVKQAEPEQAAEREPAVEVEAAASADTELAADDEPMMVIDPSELEAERVSEPATGARAAGTTPERAAARLFERANLARRAGQMKDAAAAYAELMARHPRDRRAGLAAFELGRIRMDALGDPAGAITALQRAVNAGTRASFHEDALARMVVAYDAQARRQACMDARERYLAQYPNGVHAHVLASRCR